MTLSSFAKEHRPRIASELATLTTFSSDYATPWAHDVEERYASMAGGKALRGILALVGYSAASGAAPTTEAFRLAAAIELLHATLLVHDDIMDRDELRRGKPSMYAQYAALAATDAGHFGTGMALCAGDVGILRASSALSLLAASSPAASAASQMAFRCCIETGFGQMEDFALGAGVAPATEEAVMRMLLGKTARYTCSMPLASGALLGDKPELAQQLESLGEDLGLLFQIRDDELGLFGTTEEIGKPAGSDIREGKKTLYAIYLFEAATPGEAERLAAVYGNPDSSEDDHAYVRGLLRQHGIDAQVSGLAATYAQRAEGKIAMLDIADEYRTLLRETLAFVSGRNS